MIELAIDSQEPGNVSQDTAVEPCVCISAGRVDFLDAWELQKTLHRQVADGLLSHVLLLLEHPHVYTLGRRGAKNIEI